MHYAGRLFVMLIWAYKCVYISVYQESGTYTNGRSCSKVALQVIAWSPILPHPSLWIKWSSSRPPPWCRGLVCTKKAGRTFACLDSEGQPTGRYIIANQITIDRHPSSNQCFRWVVPIAVHTCVSAAILSLSVYASDIYTHSVLRV